MDKKTSDSHPTGEHLELYSLGRLSETETAHVEEHLLICETCRQELAETDEYVRIMKQALPLATAQEPARAASWWHQLFALPRPVWAAAAGVAALLIFIPIYRDRNYAPAVLELKAVRSERRVTAPSDRPLILQLSREGVEAQGTATAVIVDGSGAEVWSGPAVVQNGHWTAKPDRKLASGMYWVRVFGGAERNQPLREFQLNVR